MLTDPSTLVPCPVLCPVSCGQRQGADEEQRTTHWLSGFLLMFRLGSGSQLTKALVCPPKLYYTIGTYPIEVCPLCSAVLKHSACTPCFPYFYITSKHLKHLGSQNQDRLLTICHCSTIVCPFSPKSVTTSFGFVSRPRPRPRHLASRPRVCTASCFSPSFFSPINQVLWCRQSAPYSFFAHPHPPSPSSAICSFHLILPCLAQHSPQPNRTTRIYPFRILHQQTELLFSTGEPGPIHPTVGYAYPTSLAHTEPRDATGESSHATKPSSFELLITHEILMSCLLNSCKLIQFHQLSNNVLEHHHQIKRNKVSNSVDYMCNLLFVMTLVVREPTGDMCCNLVPQSHQPVQTLCANHSLFHV